VSAPRIALLIGFDRSGSSMVAKLLARHPGVNLLFQPFNSTEVHRAQWSVWPPDRRARATEDFLQGLLEGELDIGYLASDWFARHSTSDCVEPDQVNLIKDTKLHFQIEWLKQRFPTIEVVGLWRDPRGILCSLMRNDFYRRWYGDAAFRKIAALVGARPELAKFRAPRDAASSDTRKMAVMVAVRTDHLFRHLGAGSRIEYEAILEDPNDVLNGLTARWGLEPFDFRPHMGEDYNIIGKPFEAADLWREFFPPSELAFLDELFSRVAR
jgi:hypothetical protein